MQYCGGRSDGQWHRFQPKSLQSPHIEMRVQFSLGVIAIADPIREMATMRASGESDAALFPQLTGNSTSRGFSRANSSSTLHTHIITNELRRGEFAGGEIAIGQASLCPATISFQGSRDNREQII